MPVFTRTEQAARLELLHQLQVQGLSLREAGRVVGLSRTRVMGLLGPPLYARRRIASRAQHRCQRCQVPLGRGAHFHKDEGLGYSPLREVVFLCLACHRKAHGAGR